MSIFNWFSGSPTIGKSVPGKLQPDSDSSGAVHEDRTRPPAGGRSKPAASQPSGVGAAERTSERKSHRHAKRELLYNAVREAMIRAGVLSASYKFKVLSLDPRGEQFMVMMDLAQEFGDQMERLTEIEIMIAQTAKLRYNIRVTAVYWRMNEMVSVGHAAGHAHVHPAHHAHAPTPAVAPAFVPSVAQTVQEAGSTVSDQEVALMRKPPPSRYEPIQADEVAAFKQAVAAAAAQSALPADKRTAAPRNAARSYTLLTGFEDTEMPDSPAAAPALSPTQYGDLN